MFLNTLFVAFTVFLFAPTGPALAIETLKWEDLAPLVDESLNPVTRLTQKQQDDIYIILWGENYGQPYEKLNTEEQAAYRRLKDSGVEPEVIFAQIEKLRDRTEIDDKTLIFDFDGRDVKLPGYVLPLDFDGTKVKSFLLVPYVGACIHTPPPPPNQIIHVKVKGGFQVKELYAPVWVTGRITAGMDSKSLSYVDGSADIPVGYALNAAKIEPYEE